MDEMDEKTGVGSIGAEIRDDISGVYKKLTRVIGDTLGSVVVHLDENVCAKLDAFVVAGVAENRSQAALYFLTEGVKAREDLFDRIVQTELQVEQLRQQIRSLKRMESAE